MKLMSFVFLMVILLVSSSVQAEDAMTQPGIASRLSQNEAMVSPFQVIVSRNGELTIEPKAIFSEGTQDSKFELPQLLTNPKPITLPDLILNQKMQGEVILAVAVKTDGTVSETMVMQASGDDTIDGWAQELAKSWQFRPAMKNGQAVYECIQIPIRFELE